MLEVCGFGLTGQEGWWLSLRGKMVYEDRIN